MHFSKISVVVAGLLAASGALAQDIALNEDGSVTASGVTQPGLSVTTPEACAALTDQAAVACAADDFLGTLTDAQKAEVLLDMTVENATAWSNLPCGAQCRVGIELSELDDTQKAAALAVIKLAQSATAGDGFDELTQIMMGDTLLTMAQDAGLSSPMGPPPDGGPEGMTPPDGMAPPDGGQGGPGGLAYSEDSYFIAFLGTPSADGLWQLQFGGHHFATLHTFDAGAEVAATPNFIGVEPKVWTVDGTTYAPLTDDRDAMVAMLAALDADELATAKLDTIFSDVLLGPGQDGAFPTEKSGLRVGDLDDDQKALVMAAISEWVADTGTTSAEAILTAYKADLDDTYIAFSGNASLDAHADYVRIDGPDVWIEFVCQNGVVFGDQIHYHTIWRDHEKDYGAVYDF